MRSRLHSLDALRGLAALVVVISHCMVISNLFSLPIFVDRPGIGTAWTQALTYTPLHLFWAGQEAVWVFFVLSGLVLTLPATRGEQAPWASYYPQRLLRLYLPLAVAVGWALALVHVTDHTVPPWRPLWLAIHPAHVPTHLIVKDLTAVDGAGFTNTVLWSLQYEVVFSLLLPLFVLAFVRLRAPWPAQAAVAAAVVVVGTRTDSHMVAYLGIFACGVVMARHLDALSRLGTTYDSAPTVVRAGVPVAAGVLLTARWPIEAAGLDLRTGFLLSVLGAVLFVWLFATTAVGTRVGDRPVLRWLGSRSFSLYLVHEPIVVAVGFLLGRQAHPLTVLPIALPLALLAAEGMFRIFERPSHLASRWVGRQLRSGTAGA